MKVRGKFVDPQKQRYRPGKPIPSENLAAFQAERDRLLAYFEPEAELPLVRKQD